MKLDLFPSTNQIAVLFDNLQHTLRSITIEDKIVDSCGDGSGVGADGIFTPNGFSIEFSISIPTIHLSLYIHR